MRNESTQYYEEHPDELKRFPEQIFASMSGGTMHLGGDETTEGVDPDRECYPAGQGTGAIMALTPAGDLLREIVADAESAIRRLEQLRTDV